MPDLFELLNEQSKQFRGTFFGYGFNKWELSHYKIACTLKTTVYEHTVFI